MRFLVLLLFVVGFILDGFSQKDRKAMTPHELTLAYISEYEKWNDFAFKNQNEDVKIEEKYKIDIILKFCLPTKKYQNIAFGSESSHSLSYEKITFEDVKSKSAIIKTLCKDPKRNYLNDVYEYHFDKINNVWYLIEVYLVDKDGKYKGL